MPFSANVIVTKTSNRVMTIGDHKLETNHKGWCKKILRGGVLKLGAFFCKMLPLPSFTAVDKQYYLGNFPKLGGEECLKETNSQIKFLNCFFSRGVGFALVELSI